MSQSEADNNPEDDESERMEEEVRSLIKAAHSVLEVVEVRVTEAMRRQVSRRKEADKGSQQERQGRPDARNDQQGGARIRTPSGNRVKIPTPCRVCEQKERAKVPDQRDWKLARNVCFNMKHCRMHTTKDDLRFVETCDGCAERGFTLRDPVAREENEEDDLSHDKD